jgi:hypothetical protein
MALDLARADVDWGEIGELLEAAYRQVAGRELTAELDRRAEARPPWFTT